MNTDGTGLLPGVEITLQGRTFIAPAMSVNTIKRAAALLPAFEAGGVGAIDAALEIVHRTLIRNYPTLTLEELAELLDMANLVPVMNAIFTRSGFSPPALAAAAPLEPVEPSAA